MCGVGDLWQERGVGDAGSGIGPGGRFTWFGELWMDCVDNVCILWFVE
jgi:hypothetical protein